MCRRAMLSDMQAQRDDMREQRDAWQRQAEARAGVVVEMASDAHANATVEVDPIWEQLGEQKLRRAAKVIFRETAEYLLLDFTIERVTIFYRGMRYRFTSGIKTLIPVITSDVEQFITAQQAAAPAHLALIKGVELGIAD